MFMEAWDVIVLGDGPAALQAASEAARTGSSTLMMHTHALGNPGMGVQNGLAANLQETNNRSFREDTIREGQFLCDQDIVSEATAQSIRIVDLLERRGVNFRRDAKGIPLVKEMFAHSKPRIVDAGSTTALEIQSVCEEQAMRHGVQRRGDQIPLSLVHDNQRFVGVIVLDLTSGKVMSIQGKALIIADGGFEGVFGTGEIGLGMDMAFRSGVGLRDMEFIEDHPMCIKDTHFHLPLGLLSDGAKIHEASGPEISLNDISAVGVSNAIRSAVQPVLDARNLGEAHLWWDGTFRRVKDRTGIDMTRQTVPLQPEVNHTIGGLPVDQHGRCIVGTWARWFTGLYAAGDAACSGLHGASSLPGNRLLDALYIGGAAGHHAGNWVADQSFAGHDLLNEALEQTIADIDTMLMSNVEGPVVRVGTVMENIHAALANTTSFDQQSLSNLLEKLNAISLQAEQLYCDQESLLMNTNLVDILKTQAGLRMLIASVQSGLSRTESRGSFIRTDFPEADEEQLHHTVVNLTGTCSHLAVKKGTGGHWILPPQ